jgi:NADH-quinone oxidoreductase subunit G
MKAKAIFLITLISLSWATQIEIELYKSPSAYEELKKSDAMIDDIDKTQFLANLKLGSKSLPLQIEMSTEEVAIINEDPAGNPPIHNIEEAKIEKASIGDKNFDLEYQFTDEILDEPLNKESKGILGLSLGDLEAKNDKKFLDQLVKNKVADNKSFYFEFDEVKVQPSCKVPTLEDYLGIKGRVLIGDFPYNVSPKKYNKDKVKTTPILQVIKNKEVPLHDESSLAIQFNMEKCIGCTACVKACSNIAGQDVLECEKKGKAHTASGHQLSNTNCISCGQCTLACAKKAITEHFDKEEVTNVLKNKNGKIAVCQFAPAIRINMAEALGVPAGQISTGKIVTALKMLGFDYIFDTNFSADMTIVEEATELVHRLNDPDAVLPMFTSCCPAWVNYVEKSRPDLIPHLSSCRSPLAMLSSVIKNVFPRKIGVERERIYNVAIMPCTAKKDEIRRPQFSDETDAVVTSRELAQMIVDAKIDFKNLEETPLDTIYSEFTGGGAIFCATGGVMEAAVRSAYKFITGKDMVPMELKAVRGTKEGIKTATVDINGVKVNVAVAHGIKNAMDLLAKIKAKEPGFENIHFLEVMACPGGCAMGGGSPKAKGKKGVEQRLDATYSIDDNIEKRVPQDNDQLNQLYEESFDGEYGSHYAHELLHTYYTNRKVEKTWGINFKQVNFNHTSISSFSSQSLIKVENNFITAPHNFFPVLQREFLNLAEVRDKCKSLISNKYQFILCNKDLDIEKFPKLDFYSDELDHTFTFEGKDLFVFDAKNDNYLMLIVFDLYSPVQTIWELGLPFLKKEKLFFDMDKENLGVCLDDENRTKTNSTYVVINVALISFLCALVIGLLFMMPSKKQRKKRANELVEDYEYTKA